MARRQRVFIPNTQMKVRPSWTVVVVWMIFFWPVGLVMLGRRISSSIKAEKLQRMMRVANVIDERDIIPIREIASRVGRPLSDVTRDIEQMISSGYFCKGTYIDHAKGALVFPEAAAVYQPTDFSAAVADIRDMVGNVVSDVREGIGNARNAARRPEKTPEPEKPKEPEKQPEPKPEPDTHEAILRSIRELDEQIADEEVSRRVRRIGELTASIFAVVREHPEREDEVRRFMNYYLPTTQKLLRSYALMEKQSYQGENIRVTRKKIEDILDTLVKAFEKQQDDLFGAEAMDVDTDITVLETMMKQDGLMSDGGFSLRKAGGH